jgi:hypothetical protein
MRALTVGMPVATAKHFAAKIAAGAVRAALAFVVLAAHAGPVPAENSIRHRWRANRC